MAEVKTSSLPMKIQLSVDSKVMPSESLDGVIPKGNAIRSLCQRISDEPQTCPECKQAFPSVLKLAFHLSVEHPEKYSCIHPKCRGRFNKRRRYGNLFLSQIKMLHPSPYPPPGKDGDVNVDPVYYLPGAKAMRDPAKGGLDINKLDDYFEEGMYLCNTPGCDKRYKSDHGLAYHVLKAVCDPPDLEMAPQLEESWAKSDAEAIGPLDISIAPNDPLLLRDHPYFPQYKWPHKEWGIWCITADAVENLTGVRGLQQKHSELDYRFASIAEKKFIEAQSLSPDINTEWDIIVLKADEVLLLLEELYAETFKKLKELRQRHQGSTQPRLGDSAVKISNGEGKKVAGAVNSTFFTVGSRRAAMEAARAAAFQASHFNSALNAERVNERNQFYDFNTKISHLPARVLLKREKRSVPRVSRFPIAMMEGQYHVSYKKFKTLEEAKNFVDPDRSLGGRRNKNNQKELVRAKIRARHQGMPDQKAMRKAARHEACGLCGGTRAKNKFLKEEELVCCATCPNVGHPSCLEIDEDLVEMIRTYEWQCIECKMCSVCRDPGYEDKMLFCDVCDRGYHTFCVGLKSLPQGRWVCQLCGICASCGTTQPGPKAKDKWRHEYDTRGDEPRFLQTLCVSCSKLFNEGDFCASCLVVYRSDDTDLPMVCCDKCDRWIHTECDGIDDDKYEDLSAEGSHYECLLCRGEQEERYDAFHRRNR